MNDKRVIFNAAILDEIALILIEKHNIKTFGRYFVIGERLHNARVVTKSDIHRLIIEYVDQTTSAIRSRVTNRIYELSPTVSLNGIELENVRRKCHTFNMATISGDYFNGYIDSRTVLQDRTYKVKPIGESHSQYYIVCPLCGEIHVHGNGKGEGALGARIKQCTSNISDFIYEIVE